MIQEIELAKLRQHPDNPRKEYRDIEELADSIKSQGILQNLTVVANPDEKGTYIVVIGNRRLAAAKLAGLTTAPCSVVDMDDKTQASTMLLENMQRNDLTVCEEAMGFQMCLDLGMTKAELSEKTGFSQTTIRHRLEIAKLDQEQLKEKESSDSFQLSLKDLYELEKIENVKTRNSILKDARDSSDLAWKVKQTVREVNRKKNADAIIKILNNMNVYPAPPKVEKDMWNSKWERLKNFDLESTEIPKEIKLKKGEGATYYVIHYNSLYVIRRAKAENIKKSPYEIEQEKRDSAKKQIQAITKTIAESRKCFIKQIISGDIAPVKNTEEVRELLWDVITSGLFVYIRDYTFLQFFSDKYYTLPEEEKAALKEKTDGLTFIQQLLIIANDALQDCDLFDYMLHYEDKKGHAMQQMHNGLALYGFRLETEEQEQIVNGTHELYVREEKDEH